MPRTRRGILYVSVALLLVLPIGLLLRAVLSASPGTASAEVVLAAHAEPLGESSFTPLEPTPGGPDILDAAELAQRGRERYDQQVKDYRCVMLKQERLKDGLTPVQEIEIRYREEPQSVYMIWRRNADQVKRALFIDDARFVDGKGRQTARVEPAGSVIRLFVKDIHMPIHGPDARKASRRTIDECGFKAIFNLLDRYNRIAEERGVLDFRYAGAGTVDDRPTHVLIRTLPADKVGSGFPDAKMILHLDQETLMPVAVYSYADQKGKELLGSYVFTQVELNPGLDDDAFRF